MFKVFSLSLFAISLVSFGQCSTEGAKSVFNSYLLALEKKDFDEVGELIDPRVFSSVNRQEYIQQMRMLDNNVDFIEKSQTIKKIGVVGERNNECFVLVEAAIAVKFKLNIQLPLSDEVVSSIKSSLKDAFSLEIDKATGLISTIQNAYYIGSKKNNSTRWYLIPIDNLSESNQYTFLPKEILNFK